MDRVVDTNFLISLWRDQSVGKAGKWLKQNTDLSLGIPWVVKAEFLSGAIHAGHRKAPVAGFLDRYTTLWPNEGTIHRFAELYAHLKKKNQLPGPHDLWIACIAIENQVPLLTRNVKQLSRIPELKIEDFG